MAYFYDVDGRYRHLLKPKYFLVFKVKTQVKSLIFISFFFLVSCTSYDLESNHAHCMGYGADVSNITSTMSDYDRFRYQGQNGMSMLNSNTLSPKMRTDCYKIDPKQTK